MAFPLSDWLIISQADKMSFPFLHTAVSILHTNTPYLFWAVWQVQEYHVLLF